MSEIKPCLHCKVEKPKEDYYINKTFGTYFHVCKECYIKQARAYQQKYFKTKNGKAAWLRATNKSMTNHPERWLARQKLRSAVATGEIKKEPCKVCGSSETQAHHYKGYLADNWKAVLWLCRLHHSEVHHKNLSLNQ